MANIGVFGQPAVAQPLGVPQQAVGAEQPAKTKVEEVRIEQSESNTCFFVMGTVKGSELRKKVMELGGARNQRVKGYKFPARDLERVCTALGCEKNVNLIDPRQTIQVEFTQKLQWSGDMAEAEARLSALGLTKKSGKTNVWVGDLAQAAQFSHAFGVTERK